MSTKIIDVLAYEGISIREKVSGTKHRCSLFPVIDFHPLSFIPLNVN